ncbi:MAG: hypothetical protein KDE47_01470, partial [Caldilineaceae bacterium]|nr:hypothetical protein [Caldilineaceae bacterium]
MLPEFVEYAAWLAALPTRYTTIQSSTLRIFTIGPAAAEVEGQLTFQDDYILDIWELLDLNERTIRYYSYELEHRG